MLSREVKAMIFRKASAGDLAQIAVLYTSAIGTEGCTWDQEYPGELEIHGDFAAGGLYVLEEESCVIGAVSVVPENELDELGCWELTDGSQREIARVVIARGHAGRGLAGRMLSRLFEELKASGCHGVRLAVACGNGAAIRTYQKLGFTFLGECEMYGSRYYLCEKEL